MHVPVDSRFRKKKMTDLKAIDKCTFMVTLFFIYFSEEPLEYGDRDRKKSSKDTEDLKYMINMT